MRQVAEAYQPPSEPARTPRPSAEQRRRWREARQFQVRAQRALGAIGMPFVEWLLLESLQELIDETGDAVSQAQVADRAGLTKMIASYWMGLMDEHGLIDRGPALDGRSYRVYVGERGADALKVAAARLRAAGLQG